MALAIIMLSLSYISVILYQIFCQTYGIGGTIQKINNISLQKENNELYKIKPKSQNLLNKIPEWNKEIKNNLKKPLIIHLNSNNIKNLPWILKPSNNISKIKVYPGDTTLIFYVIQNLSNEIITGIATYNITPSRAGIYFNKIQCFCFEEQRLKSKEFIELPILFFIDLDFLKDPKINNINNLTLSYTFYKIDEFK